MNILTAEQFQLAAAQLSEQHLVVATGRDKEGKQTALACLLSDLIKAMVPPTQPTNPIEAVARITTDVLNIRALATVSSASLGKLAQGQAINVVPSDQVFWKLADREGFVSSSYLSSPPAPPPPAPPVPSPTPPPDVVIVQPKAMSGYGAQLLGNSFDPSLAQYPVFKAVDNINAVAEVNYRNPKAVCIHRRYYPDAVQSSYIQDSGGVGAAASRWISENSEALIHLPFAYHEGFNEPGEVTPELLLFEEERLRLLAGMGIKGCVLNLGVGHTSDDLWRRTDVKRLLSAAVLFNGAVGLHCYSEGVISASTGAHFWKQDGSWSRPGDPLPAAIEVEQCWLALRVIRDKQIMASQGLKPLILVTELGLDDCGPGGSNNGANGIWWPHRVQTRGWRTCVQIWRDEGWLNGISPENFYLDQLAWWVEQTGLLGVVYAHGDTTGGDPGQFDTRGVL